MTLKEKGKKLASKFGKVPDRCGVIGCNNGDSELVELKPFDPIDHESTLIQLCPTHTVWANKRNEFAEEMADHLREKRKEIGQENIERIKELSVPHGHMREDVLMGELEDGKYLRLEDALEDYQ